MEAGARNRAANLIRVTSVSIYGSDDYGKNRNINRHIITLTWAHVRYFYAQNSAQEIYNCPGSSNFESKGRI